MLMIDAIAEAGIGRRGRVRWSRAGLAVWLVAALCLGAAAEEGLVVASWNIQHLSATGDENRKAEDYESLRRIAAAMEADVIALQEVDEEYAKKVFPGGEYVLELSTRRHVQRTGFAVRRGVSYERRADVEALDYSGEGDGRYGVHLVLNPGGMEVDALVVHLKSSCFSNADDGKQSREDDCRKLNDQVPVLEQWIDERLGDGRDVMVLGDFNRRFRMDGDRVWADLADGEPAPLALAAGSGRPGCWDGKFEEFIDHIVLGGDVREQLCRFEEIVFAEARTSGGFDEWSDRLSDHCPIRATFTMAAGGTQAADIVEEAEEE